MINRKLTVIFALIIAALLMIGTANAAVTGLVMSVDSKTPATGQLVTIQVDVINDATPVSSVAIKIDLSSGLEYFIHSPGENYQNSVWSINQLRANERRTLKIRARVLTSQPIAIPPATTGNVRSPQILLMPQACGWLGTPRSCCTPDKVTGNCGPVPCSTTRDVCIELRLPPIVGSTPSLTVEGTYAFVNIFSLAATKGVENATVRAMNGTKVCPDRKNCRFPSTWTVAELAGKQVVYDPARNAFDLTSGVQVDPTTGDPVANPIAKLIWKDDLIYTQDQNGNLTLIQ